VQRLVSFLGVFPPGGSASNLTAELKVFDNHLLTMLGIPSWWGCFHVMAAGNLHLQPCGQRRGYYPLFTALWIVQQLKSFVYSPVASAVDSTAADFFS
jgi:hypothetical protein